MCSRYRISLLEVSALCPKVNLLNSYAYATIISRWWELFTVIPVLSCTVKYWEPRPHHCHAPNGSEGWPHGSIQRTDAVKFTAGVSRELLLDEEPTEKDNSRKERTPTCAHGAVNRRYSAYLSPVRQEPPAVYNYNTWLTFLPCESVSFVCVARSRGCILVDLAHHNTQSYHNVMLSL